MIKNSKSRWWINIDWKCLFFLLAILDKNLISLSIEWRYKFWHFGSHQTGYKITTSKTFKTFGIWRKTNMTNLIWSGQEDDDEELKLTTTKKKFSDIFLKSSIKHFRKHFWKFFLFILTKQTNTELKWNEWMDNTDLWRLDLFGHKSIDRSIDPPYYHRMWSMCIQKVNML